VQVLLCFQGGGTLQGKGGASVQRAQNGGEHCQPRNKGGAVRPSRPARPSKRPGSKHAPWGREGGHPLKKRVDKASTTGTAGGQSSPPTRVLRLRCSQEKARVPRGRLPAARHRVGQALARAHLSRQVRQRPTGKGGASYKPAEMGGARGSWCQPAML